MYASEKEEASWTQGEGGESEAWLYARQARTYRREDASLKLAEVHTDAMQPCRQTQNSTS